MKSLILLTLLLFSGTIASQSFDFFKTLIDLDKETALNMLKNEGFELTKAVENDGCTGYIFARDSSNLVYNVCAEEDGDLINVNVIERDLRTAVNRLFEANQDTTLTSDISNLGVNTSFIFIEENAKEIYFVFDHFLEMYVMEISNGYRFDMMKDVIETRTEYDPENNGIALFRRILNETNGHGETVQEALTEFEIRSDFNILNVKSAYDYLKEFKDSDEYQHLKNEIDKMFLSDQFFVSKIQKSMYGIKTWHNSDENTYDRIDDKIFLIALENNLFISLVMMDYICESAIEK